MQILNILVIAFLEIFFFSIFPLSPFLELAQARWASAPCQALCWMPRGRRHSRKVWSFYFSISFSDSSFEAECFPRTCPCLFVDSSSLSVLSSLFFIFVLPEWDRSFPMTSKLTCMMIILSLQISHFSLVLRIFSTIKRNFKPIVFKLNFVFSHPNSCSFVFSSFSFPCCTKGTSVPSSWAKNLEVIWNCLFFTPALGPFINSVNSTVETFLESSSSCLLVLLHLFPCQAMLWA